MMRFVNASASYVGKIAPMRTGFSFAAILAVAGGCSVPPTGSGGEPLDAARSAVVSTSKKDVPSDRDAALLAFAGGIALTALVVANARRDERSGSGEESSGEDDDTSTLPEPEEPQDQTPPDPEDPEMPEEKEEEEEEPRRPVRPPTGGQILGAVIATAGTSAPGTTAPITTGGPPGTR
jgi:hypothetical protein